MTILGVACGDDGCGGSCGACAGGQLCELGQCVWNTVAFPAVCAVFQGSGCADGQCHDATQPAQGLDLSAQSAAYGALVGQSSTQCSGQVLVVPGDSAASYLVAKLTGSGMCFGSRMPKAPQPALTAAELGVVQAWTASGAAPQRGGGVAVS